jgi:hypothetical protein
MPSAPESHVVLDTTPNTLAWVDQCPCSPSTDITPPWLTQTPVVGFGRETLCLNENIKLHYKFLSNTLSTLSFNFKTFDN